MKLIQKTAATRRNEIEGVLKQKGVSIGDTKMDPKKPPGKDGQTEVMITTNVYPLELQSANEQFIYHYEVNVVGIGSKENENDISQQTYPADYLKVLDRTRCAVVFLAFWEKLKSQDMNTWNTIAYYDCRKALFAVKELQQIEDTLSLEEVNRIYLLPDEKFRKFRVTISNAVEGTPAKVSLSQFQRITSDAEPSDRSVEQFVDIATSQNIFKGMGKFIHFSTALSYLLSPVEYGFKDEDCPYFSSNNSYLGIGVGKGARVIEGSHPEEPALALVINIVKSPFHAHEALLAKLEVVFRNVDLATVANGELERIGRYFKGLWVETNYLPHQAFPIHDIVKENAQTVKLDENATIQDHFKKKDINLIHPDYPLVVRRGADGKLSHFPIEVLWVSDNQRVKTAQQVPAQLQEMIRKCAVPPILKLEENKRVKNALSLQDDVHLKGAGIKFKDEPLKVKGRVIAPPELQFGGGRPVRPKDNGTWTGTGHFLHKANCSMWCAYAITDRRNRQDITLDEWNNFLQRYYQFLTQKGLNWPYPEDVRVFPVASVNVKQLIYDAAQNGAEFCLIAHPDSADHIHHQMKLNERQTEMVTQGLKIGTVRSVLSKGQQLTLSNIANKTNMKMGGENYTLATLREPVIDEDTLIIGFSVNHPGGGLGMAAANGNGEGGGNGGNGKNGQGNGKNGHGNGNGKNGHGNGNGKSAPGNGNGKNGGHGGYASAIQAPSVVGYSANIGQHDKFEFIGGYMFQEPRRDEKVAIISNAVKNCAEQFKENRHRDPKRIVIYRNGCSEGFFQHILRYEIPMVKSALEELNIGHCRLTLMVVNKLQNIALIPSKLDARAKAADQNVKPGTVVDTQIVHPKWNEFFLNSHRAIQGTTRTPKYSVLLDENAHTMDQLQKLTYSLCYGHQIVFSPTSLPSPVYIADEYAKRGRNNYNTMAAEEVFANYDQMDMVLGLSQTNYLRKLRFNA